MELPFSQAADNNKQPILNVIKPLLSNASYVLEVGSGTGQHAEFFSQQMPHIQWQPTDRWENIAAINLRRERAGNANFLSPLELDVNEPWPMHQVENIYTANTLHIMSWPEVEQFFFGINKSLQPGGLLIVYGPFNYHGDYTSESNRAFDHSLRQRDPASGLRDFESVNTLAAREGLQLLADHAMPANNHCVVWRRGE